MNRTLPKASIVAAALTVGFLWSAGEARADWYPRGHRWGGSYYSAGYSSYGGCGPRAYAPRYRGSRSYYSRGYHSGFGRSFGHRSYYSRGSFCAPRYRSGGFGFSVGYSGGHRGGFRHSGFNRGFNRGFSRGCGRRPSFRPGW